MILKFILVFIVIVTIVTYQLKVISQTYFRFVNIKLFITMLHLLAHAHKNKVYKNTVINLNKYVKTFIFNIHEKQTLLFNEHFFNL